MSNIVISTSNAIAFETDPLLRNLIFYPPIASEFLQLRAKAFLLKNETPTQPSFQQ